MTQNDRTSRDAAASHRTVRRVAEILEAVAASPDGLRFSDIVTALDAPKSSVHGLVSGLVEAGLLHRVATRYVTGGALERLAPSNQALLVRTARAPMEYLANAFEETVVLAVLVGTRLTYLATIESPHAIRFVPPTVRPDSPVPSAALKVFLAHASDDVVDWYLDGRLPDPADRLALRSELSEVQERGVAFNRGETLQGMSAASAPIFSASGVVACLSIGGPTTRVGSALDAIGDAVRNAASEVTGSLRVR